MSLAHPQTGAEWRSHWDVIGFCWQEDQPLRERQAEAAFRRDHFRCGGCSGYATHLEPDSDPETGEELSPVPLCATCTIEDATPCTVWDWSDEHKAARPPELPDWGEPFSRSREPTQPEAPAGPRAMFFAFTIDRARWLRGQGDGKWLLDDERGRLCATAFYLRAKDAAQPETSFSVDTPKRLSAAYEFCTGLHHLSVTNERADIDDVERERQLVEAFRVLGVALTFTGSAA